MGARAAGMDKRAPVHVEKTKIVKYVKLLKLLS